MGEIRTYDVEMNIPEKPSKITINDKITVNWNFVNSVVSISVNKKQSGEKVVIKIFK